MAFNSFEFVFFFASVFFVVSFLRPHNYRVTKFLLLATSLLFYGYHTPSHIVLLLVPTIIAFYLGKAIGPGRNTGARQALLIAGIAANLALLGYFKYATFVASNINALATSAGLSAPFRPLEVLLPIGVSFFIFHIISYLIDVYRGKYTPTDSFVDFALYVSFFPQLIAGPILRFNNFDYQLVMRSGRRAVENLPTYSRAIWFLAIGLIKKLVLADSLSTFVDPVFDDPGAYSSTTVWLALYCYTFQIYLDFSGYSDIAEGLANLLGFRLVLNFNAPYAALNVKEFWHRWHISLSTWLRDYLFVSVGGSRGSTWFTCRNLMITMILGGLWHGANWTFVIWGVYHGILLCAHSVLSGSPRFQRLRIPRWLSICFTFHAIVGGWLIFRSPDLSSAILFAHRMFSGSFDWPFNAWVVLSLLLICALFHRWETRRDWNVVSPKLSIIGLAASTTLVLVAILLHSHGSAQFIYFQF